MAYDWTCGQESNEGDLRVGEKTEERKTIVVFVPKGWNCNEAIASIRQELEKRPQYRKVVLSLVLKSMGRITCRLMARELTFYARRRLWIQNNTLCPPRGYLSFKNIFHQDDSRCILIAKPPIKIKWEHSCSREAKLIEKQREEMRKVRSHRQRSEKEQLKEGKKRNLQNLTENRFIKCHKIRLFFDIETRNSFWAKCS